MHPAAHSNKYDDAASTLETLIIMFGFLGLCQSLQRLLVRPSLDAHVALDRKPDRDHDHVENAIEIISIAPGFRVNSYSQLGEKES